MCWALALEVAVMQGKTGHPPNRPIGRFPGELAGFSEKFPRSGTLGKCWALRPAGNALDTESVARTVGSMRKEIEMWLEMSVLVAAALAVPVGATAEDAGGDAYVRAETVTKS